MATTTYHLKIAYQGYEFEAGGDKAFVLEMFKRFGPQTIVGGISLKGKEKLAQGSKGIAGDMAAAGTKALSIREFMQRLGFTKHTDITVAFGYYLEKYSGISEFTPADINNCYYEAKLEASNTSQMIIHNIKRGYLMPSRKKSSKGKNLYTLTSSGEAFIKDKFSAKS